MSPELSYIHPTVQENTPPAVVCGLAPKPDSPVTSSIFRASTSSSNLALAEVDRRARNLQEFQNVHEEIAEFLLDGKNLQHLPALNGKVTNVQRPINVNISLCNYCFCCRIASKSRDFITRSTASVSPRRYGEWWWLLWLERVCSQDHLGAGLLALSHAQRGVHLFS